MGWDGDGDERSRYVLPAHLSRIVLPMMRADFMIHGGNVDFLFIY